MSPVLTNILAQLSDIKSQIEQIKAIDLDDPDSEVATLVKLHKVLREFCEHHTTPNVVTQTTKDQRFPVKMYNGKSGCMETRLVKQPTKEMCDLFEARKTNQAVELYMKHWKCKSSDEAWVALIKLCFSS